MTSTPPLRLISLHDPPPTPRHGPIHDDLEPRYTTRSSRRKAASEAKSTPEPHVNPRTLRSATTPESKQQMNGQQGQHNLSPPASPSYTPKRDPSRRVQVLSPSSPGIRTRSHDTSSSTNPSFTSSSAPHSFVSNSTVMSDGMLPTPVKTPRKKVVPKAHLTARALFQELPHGNDEIMPSPKSSRRSKRHNGFTLGSSNNHQQVQSSVQIFTDSRDNVPELDLSEENPFVNHNSDRVKPAIRGMRGATKRRKISTEPKQDAQVEEATKNDEGMIYVFRGKKVFKRFDDRSEEEETTIDPDDLGLLEQTDTGLDAVRLLKPLTRRSIKPTRLFQTEEQKQAREAEKAEEELTDIEDDGRLELEPSINVTGPSTLTEDATPNRRQTRNAKSAKSPQTLRAFIEPKDGNSEEEGGVKLPIVEDVKKATTGSPFDLWKRAKSGASNTEVASVRGRKRASAAVEESEPSNIAKRLRNR